MRTLIFLSLLAVGYSQVPICRNLDTGEIKFPSQPGNRCPGRYPWVLEPQSSLHVAATTISDTEEGVLLNDWAALRECMATTGNLAPKPEQLWFKTYDDMLWSFGPEITYSNSYAKQWALEAIDSLDSTMQVDPTVPGCFSRKLLRRDCSKFTQSCSYKWLTFDSDCCRPWKCDILTSRCISA